MAAVNLSALVVEAWDNVQREANGPGIFVVLETKDGRRFVRHMQFHGGKCIECPVEYRPRRNSRRGYGPICTGHFDITTEAVRVNGQALTVWRQRRGRHEPRFDRVSREWCPIDKVPSDLSELRPKPFDWSMGLE